MPAIWYFVLPASTWIIYLLDHVVDVRRKDADYPTPRHRFIKKHLHVVIAFIIVSAAFIFILAIIYFNRILFICGIILTLIVLLHLIIVRVNPLGKSIFNNKELAIAFVYAGGIYAGPLSSLYISGGNLLLPVLCYMLFMVVTYINLLMASIIEYDYDVQMGNSSMVHTFTKEKAIRVFNILPQILIVAAMGLLIITTGAVRWLIILYALIAVAHIILFKYQNALRPYLAYRKLAELSFWLPALILLY